MRLLAWHPSLLFILCIAGCRSAALQPARTERAPAATKVEWRAYGGDPGGARFSSADQIRRENVNQLQVAWTYHTGDFRAPTDGRASTAFETTPIFVDGTLFLSTPFGRVIALDPAIGRERWTFDPKLDREGGYGDWANRGVSTWLDPERAAGEKCRRRIFVAPVDARLIALDAATGSPCSDFGKAGQIDLRQGLLNAPAPDRYGDYEETSPPAVIDDLVIVGSGIADNYKAEMPSGVVRAFDARTGALRWSWDPIPRDPASPFAKEWRSPHHLQTGAANAWSIISVDPERDLVFVPTGSASPDYFGGERLGNNRFANSVVVLHAKTGQVAWDFQTVHHDLWDYDVASQPTLFTAHRDGREIPAVAVGSKTAHLFLLDRETGAPLFGVDERPVPPSDIPGEQASPTQPFPRLPRALAPQELSADEAWGATPDGRAFCRQKISGLRARGIFNPPSIQGSLVVPGNIGGMAWGGMAWHPGKNLLLVPTNRLAAMVRLIPRDRYRSEWKPGTPGEFASQLQTPYGMYREFLLTPDRIPCTPPPWGALSAVDTTTGEIRWQVALGYLPWLADRPEAKQWGSPIMGGPIATAGDLVFIAGTMDPHLRALDIDTGRVLWEAQLPFSAQATPMTFRLSDGRQFVVVAAGGHGRLGTPVGDAVVAFALPTVSSEHR